MPLAEILDKQATITAFLSRLLAAMCIDESVIAISKSLRCDDKDSFMWSGGG
jgi:hypothetical protein